MNKRRFFVAASSAGLRLKPAMPSRNCVICTEMSPLCSNAFLSTWCKLTKQFALVRVKVEANVMSAKLWHDSTAFVHSEHHTFQWDSVGYIKQKYFI
jgi:hypothetical protein